MPKMTGLELSNEIKKLRDDIPIILCSGRIEKLSGINVPQVKIARYLKKPIDLTELLSVIREVFDTN